MQIIYACEGQEFQAEITKIENGKIFTRTVMTNGDMTEEHELQIFEIVRTV